MRPDLSWLTPERARIFRITHVDNLSWVLENGLHCANSELRDPNFICIGLQKLIERRRIQEVPVGPGGTLSDYVPFYFTPRSIMLLNIKTGHNEVVKRANTEIVILVSSLNRLAQCDLKFVFTSGHAKLAESDYFDSVEDLDEVDWKLLRSGDFERDPDDPGKPGRYQAEALVHRQVPVEALKGIACYNDQVASQMASLVAQQGLEIPVKVVADWYF